MVRGFVGVTYRFGVVLDCLAGRLLVLACLVALFVYCGGGF